MTDPGTPATPAEMYERFFVPGMFRPLAREVLALMSPRPGQSLLDLACGTGVVARLAAPAIGAGGRVVALDLRPGMLDVARNLPAPAGAAIEWVEGDATSLPFPDGEFDLVCCQQGLQFFPDRGAALAEAHRVLKPGGRAVFALWLALEHQGLFGAVAPIEKAALGALGIDTSDIDLPFILGDRDEVRALLEDAGFADIHIEPVRITTDFPAADFLENVEFAYSAVVPEFVTDPIAFPQFIRRLTADSAAILRTYTHGDRIRFDMHANVAMGTTAPARNRRPSRDVQ